MEENFLTKKKVKSIIESLFFINEKPMKVDELIQTIEAERKEIEMAVQELIAEYSQRDCGICIVQVAGGYQMCSSPDNETWIKKMYREINKHKLSIAALETLAIIAYKQPITRSEIEIIRGVNVDGVTKHLLNLGLIKLGGRKEVIGRPFFYVTAKKFLEYFGLNVLKDLPKLEDFIELAGTDAVARTDVVAETDAVAETKTGIESRAVKERSDNNISVSIGDGESQ
ncbi:MAG: SMC-Scp complex subunit ScpB [Candidatus Omnitrophica bacterium]|nr:SMC-Scp complex subunit ScpB [Candidatus Omnitrophota bacterium]